MNLNKATYLFLLIVLFPVFAVAQTLNEKGVLNIRNYSPQEYGAHAQNLCIVQDKRGVMYFGNNSGVLEYDGTYWNLIDISSGKSVTSLGVDSTGKVYVGADEEIGYLAPSGNGKLTYHSFLPLLPEYVNELGRIVGIYADREGVYFVTKRFILLWNGKEFITTEVPEQIHTSFLAGDQLYISQKSVGISVYENGKLRLLPGSEFLSENNVYDISVFRGNLIVTTSDKGIFFYNGGVIRRAPAEVNNVYNAVNVFNTYYVIGLYGDGLSVFNKNFELEFSIGLSNGLEEGTISDVYVDKENNVWLALGRGIAKIELVSPISLHNFNTGLKGTVQDAIRSGNTLYVSTSNGVFYLDKNESGNRKFKQVPNLSIDCYGMCNFILDGDTILLASGVDGVYEIKRDLKPHKIVEGAPWLVQQSKTYRNRVIVGEYGALSSFVRKDRAWEAEGIVKGIDADINNFFEEKNGTLWLGTTDRGVIRTTTKIFKDEDTQVEYFDSLSGLPDGPVVIAPGINGELYFGTDNGVYRFDEGKNHFYPDPKYTIESETGKSGIHRLAMDKKGQLWVSVFYDEGKSYDIMYHRNNNWYKTPFLRYNSEIVQSIFHESDGITWLGSAAGLIRYDQEFQKIYDSPYSVSIRKVIASNRPIFEGAFFSGDSALIDQQPEDADVSLRFSQNNITFEFSALTYFDEKGTLYSYLLEGQSEEWSDWSPTGRAIFTNIHEGSYLFRVKAKNIYNVESAETVFRFVVLPPWYRTIWAYIGYFILFVAFVWGAISVSTRSLKRIIQERTAEIVHQKEEIEKQKEIVEEKNKDILDSIKYAKRIQDAILPGEETMREVMGRDLFVLFRPKDIVSGDFYWMRVKGPKALFAAVDCTGHGVPGAFVSIVGNNGLNRAVNEFGLIQPAAILDNLTASVEDSFRQQGHSEVRDGMDISLCSLEMVSFNKAVLEWSGANNPLWIIKAENPTEIIEVKPDKQPIGKFENRKPFTNHSFDLVKGDTLYIFTDGFADQFGGPVGKKFKYSQLKEFLISIQTKNMQEQRTLLFDRFDEWKNELEQIDDVCMIGVRI